MVFDEKVLTALEVLTDAAENDFELHRICTLIRDLVSPPKAEQVGEKRQRFNGNVYKRQKGGHYGIIHRDVWAYYNGEIPEGYDIHHDNENPADNSIGNLVALPKDEHHRIHIAGHRICLKNSIPVKCKNCGVLFYTDHGGRKFCCEKCCKDFFYAKKKKAPGVVKTCKYCGKTFTAPSVYKNKNCCSRSCAQKWWRARKKD